MSKKQKELPSVHPVAGSYLTGPDDVSVGQVAIRGEIAGLGTRDQSGGYDRCLTYGGINRCFDLEQ